MIPLLSWSNVPNLGNSKSFDSATDISSNSFLAMPCMVESKRKLFKRKVCEFRHMLNLITVYRISLFTLIHFFLSSFLFFSFFLCIYRTGGHLTLMTPFFLLVRLPCSLSGHHRVTSLRFLFIPRNLTTFLLFILIF